MSIMKKKSLVLGLCITLLVLLSACVIHSNKKITQSQLDSIKTEYENYLKQTYPNETFQVDVWTEYGIGTSTGLPDYEGYLLRHIVTDSKGNRFRIYSSGKNQYSDDYQAVLDGRKHYNEIGQTVLYDDEGNVISEFY